MRLDLPDNLVSHLLKVLAEVPAKHSYVLLEAINIQAAKHNKRVQRAAEELDARVPQTPNSGGAQADPLE